MTDPIAAIRKHTDPRSQAASDSQAAFRKANGIPSDPETVKAQTIPAHWLEQFEAREK